MEKNTLHVRLTALDGLRGFAILLVFLSHMSPGFVSQFLPSYLFGWIDENGVTGVTFLFILSGFLMSTIYPNPKSTSAFLQKRYTRIFPLFLTMCAVMFAGRITQTNSPITLIEILFGFAFITYLFWTQIIKRLPKIFGKMLFSLFITLQLFSGLLYIFWINKISFAEFSNLPLAGHEVLIFLINATLTLPLGQYAPMLDGVYWTLVAEVLFYVLYPIFIVPLAKFLAKKSLSVKVIFLFCLIPLLGGLHMISYKIFVLSLIQPALFFYFATGIFLGYLYRKYTKTFSQISFRLFPGILGAIPFLLFFLTLALINDLSFLGQIISPWVRMLFAIPLTFFVAILLDNKSVFSKFFSSKALAYIGTVSYSMYLSHSLVIHIARLIYQPTGNLAEFFFIITVFLINIGIASLLFFLLERPYFLKSHDTTINTVSSKKAFSLSWRLIFIGVSMFYVVGVFAAYQSKNSFNFFSVVEPLNQKAISFSGSKTGPFIKITTTSSATLTIHASENNFGLISMKISHMPRKSPEQPQIMYFSLREKGSSQVIAASSYSIDKFDKNPEFPFGFPIQTSSKDKTYLATFSLPSNKTPDAVFFNTTTMNAVYAADKKQLVTHPQSLLSFTWSKLSGVLRNTEAQIAFLFLSPFLIFSLYSLVVGKRRNFGYN